MSNKPPLQHDMQTVFYHAVVKAILAMGKVEFEKTSFFASNWHTKDPAEKEAA